MKRSWRISALAFAFLLFGLTIYYFYPETKLPPDKLVDRMVVLKSKHRLLAYSNGDLLKTYPIAIGRGPVGQKEFEGDKKTPEGLYFISDKNPNGQFHKSLTVSYPNKNDIDRINKTGKPTGGGIQIHGIRNGFGFIGKLEHWTDWTAGCIALTNEDLDELFAHCPVGIPIEIKP